MVKSILHRVTILPVLAALLLGASAHAQTPARYVYPTQPGGETIKNTDPNCKLLNDGSDETGSVWGQWDVKPFIVDWTFAQPVRIRSVRVSMEHPVNPQSADTHPRELLLFVRGNDGKFSDLPDARVLIPFQAGPRQVAELTLPGQGLLASELRTYFEGTNHQVVLSEITFQTEPTSAAELNASLHAAAESRPEPLKTVDTFPAAPLLNAAKPPASSIFGAAGHMLHHDHFYPGHFSQYWRLEYTLPILQRMGLGSVREPIYEDYFFSHKQNDTYGEDARVRNRQLIDDYLTAYDRAGISVIICTVFSGSGEADVQPSGARSEAFFRWIGELAKRHPCVEAVEMNNEPNLPPFWQHDFQTYIDVCRDGAAILRQVKPDLPIIVGSFSGMGGVWQRPELLEEAGNSEAEQAIHWARKCFEAGMLDFADGVSTHPYNESNTQPEGGVFLQSRTDPDGYEKELRDFWALVQKYNKTNRPLKLYFTELGYESTNNLSPEMQANYLSRLMLILFSTRVSGDIPLQRVHWYDLKVDDAIVGASGWGLIAHNASYLRPAGVVYQRIARFFGDTDDFKPLNVDVTYNNWPDVVKDFVWQRKSDGAIVLAFWRMNQSQKQDVDFDTTVTLRLPSGMSTPTRVEVVDLHDVEPMPVGFKADGRVLETAVHVTDRAAWLVIHP